MLLGVKRRMMKNIIAIMKLIRHGGSPESGRAEALDGSRHLLAYLQVSGEIAWLGKMRVLALAGGRVHSVCYVQGEINSMMSSSQTRVDICTPPVLHPLDYPLKRVPLGFPLRHMFSLPPRLAPLLRGSTGSRVVARGIVSRVAGVP